VLALCAGAQVCSTKPVKIKVASAGDAKLLAAAAACANADVSAIWQGKVQLLKTIVAGAGTSLTVSGNDPEAAIIEGGGKIQLLTLTGGFNDATDGGAVSIGEFASLVVTGSIFANNVVVGDPGYSSSTSSSADSTAIETGGGAGGAVYGALNSTISIINSIFINNTASTAGGGILSEASLGISNSSFHNNAAAGGGSTGGGGGAIWCSQDLVVSNSNFTNNSADSGDDLNHANGGAVRHRFKPNQSKDYNIAVIEHSIFKDNLADGGGGAGVLSGDIIMTECVFEGIWLVIGGELSLLILRSSTLVSVHSQTITRRAPLKVLRGESVVLFT
jgi:hypothetical protein